MQAPKELRKTNFLDYSILIPFLILTVIGVIMVYSTTVPAQLESGQNIYKPIINQVSFVIFSLIFMFIIYRLKIRAFKSSTFLGIFVPIEIVLLLYSRFGPNTYAATGAHGWIPIPGIGTIQPSEFLKLFAVWYLALILSKRQERIAKEDYKAIFERKRWYQNIFHARWFFLIFMLFIVFIMPDLGNVIIVLAVILTMIASSGISYKWASGYFRMALVPLVIIFTAIFVTGGNLIKGRYSYINARFEAFIDPFKGLATYGHQLANSYYAISNGGWLGRGLGNSIEKKGYLPEASTDFVFSIVVEELGVIGAILILGILFFLILRILLVGIRARDPFNSLIAIGVGTMLLVQGFINAGGAIGLIPETGVTFPFISQGGSSYFILSIAIALVLNVAAHERLLSLGEAAQLQERRRGKRWK